MVSGVIVGNYLPAGRAVMGDGATLPDAMTIKTPSRSSWMNKSTVDG